MEFDLNWWKNDSLANNVYSHLRLREENIPRFLHQSPQLGSRRHLVDWLAIISQARHLSSTGQHLAVLLMDLFMDHHTITEPLVKLVALTCLSLAAKFEDKESLVPSYRHLRDLAKPSVYSNQHFMNMEIKLLHFFEWSISFPTAAHFAEYFLDVSVTAGDFCGDKPIVNALESAKEYVRKYVYYFLEISLQDHVYRQYNPSQVSASCVASARSCLQMAPLWSMTLQKVTKYSLQQLQPIVQTMLKTHSQDCQMSQLNKVAESPVGSTGSSVISTPASAPETPTTPDSHCCDPSLDLTSSHSNSMETPNTKQITPVMPRKCLCSVGNHLGSLTMVGSGCSAATYSLVSLEELGGES